MTRHTLIELAHERAAHTLVLCQAVLERVEQLAGALIRLIRRRKRVDRHRDDAIRREERTQTRVANATGAGVWASRGFAAQNPMDFVIGRPHT